MFLFSFYRFLAIPILLAVILSLLPAMPAATTTVILAQKYNRNPKFASKLLVGSTVLSMVTIPAVTSLLEYL